MPLSMQGHDLPHNRKPALHTLSLSKHGTGRDEFCFSPKAVNSEWPGVLAHFMRPEVERFTLPREMLFMPLGAGKNKTVRLVPLMAS